MADKYGVKDLAEVMKVETATARVKLRAGKIKKNGRKYEWSSKAELAAVAKQLESVKAPAKKAAKKVAKKAAPKKAAKKAAPKKAKAEPAADAAATPPAE